MSGRSSSISDDIDAGANVAKGDGNQTGSTVDQQRVEAQFKRTATEQLPIGPVERAAKVPEDTVTATGNGMAATNNGLTATGNGLATPGNGLATPGNGLATPGNGLAITGNGLIATQEVDTGHSDKMQEYNMYYTLEGIGRVTECWFRVGSIAKPEQLKTVRWLAYVDNVLAIEVRGASLDEETRLPGFALPLTRFEYGPKFPITQSNSFKKSRK